MKKSFFILAAGVAVSLSAAPKIDGVVAFVQDDASDVTITYGIKDEPAIVTVDIQTNSPSGYLSIDQTWLTNVTGDVNSKVDIGTGKKICWKPSGTVPGRFRVKDARVVVTLHATNSPPDYIVLDLSDQTAAGSESMRFYPNAEQIPLGVTNRIYKTRYYVMRRIHAAGIPWPMGAASGDAEKTGNEIRHWVALPEDYYLGIFEVTQGHMKEAGLTDAVASQCNTSVANADCCPAAGANGITYNNIRASRSKWPTEKDHSLGDTWAYLQYFRDRVGPKWLVDIPTEAQWEYAARAGLYAKPYSYGGGNSSDGFGAYAWFKDSIPVGTTIQEVGTRLPNKWGLYDMFGNVCEWCLDNFWYNCGLHLDGYDAVDFSGPALDYDGKPDKKVVRGGSYDDDATKMRSSYRAYIVCNSATPIVGYRLSMQAVCPY